ncbi:hypothetical protein ACEQ8H_004320 [Pleosporales sp. CAS-2024a]
MESVTDSPAQPRRTRTSTPPTHAPAAPATYGYHNTYHTHALLPVGAPPPYACATDPKTLRRLHDRTRTETHAARTTPRPPAYSPSVHISGVLGVKPELATPFDVAASREWFDAFVVLQGTQLSIYRVKLPGLFSKSCQPSPGKHIQSYSLQHAEVGVASDFKKTPLIPKSPFAHLVPASTRPRLYETDPHLFEPVREHAIRLRAETEQFLICTPTQETMLDWIEALCAAVDISPPIEDRSEPRYRTLPRRSRRQRILDSAQLGETMENLSSLEAGRRIIAQQEQIIRQLYPHLAGSPAASRDSGGGYGVTTTVSSAAAAPSQGPAPTEAELLDDFDPEDVRFPMPSSRASQLQDDDDFSTPSPAGADRKYTPITRPSASQTLRYRRRCAPVLLAASPRVSDVVVHNDQRLRIDVKTRSLVLHEPLPPRYEAHKFSKLQRLTKLQRASQMVPPERPASPTRGASDDSITTISFGEDLHLSIGLAPTRSAEEDVSAASGPPSPTHPKLTTGDVHGKRIDATTGMVDMDLVV